MAEKVGEELAIRVCIPTHKLSKTQLIEIVRFLMSRSNIKVSAEMRKALSLYEKNNISITDCLVIVFGEGNKIASFDERLVSMIGARSVWG